MSSAAFIIVVLRINFSMQGNFSCFCCRLLTFFKINFFPKILSGTLLECQMVWIQMRNDILLVLIWVQTNCKGYQQMTKDTCKERIKLIYFNDSVNIFWCKHNNGLKVNPDENVSLVKPAVPFNRSLSKHLLFLAYWSCYIKKIG